MDKLGIVTSEYHLYRAGLFARQQGVEPVGIPAKTSKAYLFVDYFLREILGRVVLHDFLGGFKKMLDRKYADIAWEQAAALLAIDSPTGFTAKAGRLGEECL